MNNKEKYFKLFANCIPVKGASRSVICDLQYNSIRFIPNLLYDLLLDNKDKSVDQIKKVYDNEYDEGIDLFFNQLEEEGLGFWCKNPESFPDLNLEWDFPAIITNAIIDINKKSEHDFEKIFSELETLGCQFVQIRIYNSYPIYQLESNLLSCKKSKLRSIELFIPYEDGNHFQENLKNLVLENRRLLSVYVHSSPIEKEIKISNNHQIRFINQRLKDNSCCGIISKEYFTPNIPTFTEAIHFNSCLNRKISIDVDGSIKNCPSMNESYGKIEDTSLLDVVNIEKYKKYWGINKDQILVCKDCEFRYVCTDCRAFVEDANNNFSKPAKCSYNPYTEKWESTKSPIS